jgi:hypothetical protein
MNCDTAVNTARELNALAASAGKKVPFVMVSSAKAPPFLQE